MVEERVDSSSDPERQFIWGLRYIDDLVLRDRDTTGNGTLDERCYALQDANWNVTSTVSGSGAVQQRLAYHAYGAPVFLTAAFASGTNTDDWETLYGGYRYGRQTAFYLARHRSYSFLTGSWLQRDPLGTAVAENLYEYVSARPLVDTDPTGLHPCVFGGLAGVAGSLLWDYFRGDLDWCRSTIRAGVMGLAGCIATTVGDALSPASVASALARYFGVSVYTAEGLLAGVVWTATTLATVLSAAADAAAEYVCSCINPPIVSPPRTPDFDTRDPWLVRDCVSQCCRAWRCEIDPTIRPQCLAHCSLGYDWTSFAPTSSP